MPLLPKIPAKSKTERIQREILEIEAKIGAEIFGPLEKGRKRSFFCLNRYTWVWHEQWIDHQKSVQTMMTYYHIRSTGIVKSSGNNDYKALSEKEFHNFVSAVKNYSQIIPEKLSAKYL